MKLQKSKTYSPNTKAAYTFTRPYVNNKPTAYMQFLLRLWNGEIITTEHVKSMHRPVTTYSPRPMWTGFSITVQNLRMFDLVKLENGVYSLTDIGINYVNYSRNENLSA